MNCNYAIPLTERIIVTRYFSVFMMVKSTPIWFYFPTRPSLISNTHETEGLKKHKQKGRFRFLCFSLCEVEFIMRWCWANDGVVLRFGAVWFPRSMLTLWRNTLSSPSGMKWQSWQGLVSPPLQLQQLFRCTISVNFIAITFHYPKSISDSMGWIR